MIEIEEKEGLYVFATAETELAERETCYELTRRSCWYGYPNLNGTTLAVETAEEMAKTLIGMPVVAKYKKINNKDDLGGHEVTYDKEKNPIFNTTRIGANTEVSIRDAEVEINGEVVTTPCLYVKSKIWKRGAENVCAAIKRLYAEKKLHSSWEIKYYKYNVINGKKTLINYEFEADCLLGSKSKPAYGDFATTLEIAEADYDTELAEAVYKDYKKQIENEEEIMGEKEKNPETKVTSDGNGGEALATVTPDVKGITINSIINYPEQKTEGTSENATLELEKLQNEIATKNSALIDSEKEIADLKAQIVELSEIKVKYEAEMAEKEKVILAEKQAKLKEYALSSGYITESDIKDYAEISELINKADENGIKAIIADRLISAKKDSTKGLTSTSEVTKTSKSAVTNLNNSEDVIIDYEQVIRAFLNK